MGSATMGSGKQLKRLLQAQVLQFQEAGGTPSGAIAALSAYRKILARRLIAQSLACLALLVVGAYVALSLFSEQSALAAVVTTFFGLAATLITNLSGTWRDLNYTALILMLIQDLDDGQIKAVIDKLIDKL